nr:hypothetical protein [Priestia megaterium]
MERASKGETDLDVEGIGVNKYTKEVTTSKGNIIEYDVTEYMTAQLIEKRTMSNGDNSETYAVNLIASYDGSRGDSKWDDSYGVRASSTIYIEKSTYSGTDYWRLIRSEGGWDRQDSSLTLTNPYTIQGTVGQSRDELYENQTINRDISYAGSYGFDAPSYWEPVNSKGVSAWAPHVGETSHVDIYRTDPSNSWHLSLNNEYK